MKNVYLFRFGILFFASVALFVACEKDDANEGITVKDIDGNLYHGVKIGNQVWMKENLNVTRFRNGDPIPTTNPFDLNITDLSAPVYQWITENDEANAAIYGRLYTWHAATDSRGICPEGWRIPTDDDWNDLWSYLGADDAGSKIREAGTTHWYSASTANNSSGFTALPGDLRRREGNYSGIVGFYGYWWTSTSSIGDMAFYYSIDYTCFITRAPAYKNHGLSIRCIKD
ncbi:MAG: fibrobacter succinogenes major paralogous domain-containing protein [Bacteroidales bacterium]